MLMKNEPNIDKEVVEKCGLSEASYQDRARTLCMDFCYLDKEHEVYSDEEGVQKAINGYVIGDTRGKKRREMKQ